MLGGLVKRDKILKCGTVETSPLEMEAFEPLIIDGREMMENVLPPSAPDRFVFTKHGLLQFVFYFFKGSALLNGYVQNKPLRSLIQA